MHCVDYNCFGAITSNVTFIFDLNYFLWKLKTSEGQGVSFLLEKKNTKFFDLTNSRVPVQETLNVASNFMSPTLNFQSHWRPAGRNFGAPKNMGGLCFQVLESYGVLGVFVFKTPILDHLFQITFTHEALDSHSSELIF